MKSAIVTGASSGIGRAAATKLAAEGFGVLAVGRDEASIKETCRHIAETGGRAVPMLADVTASDAPRVIIEKAVTALGGIDALVNAAGIIASGPVGDTTDDEWDRMMDINVRAPFRLIREAIPALVESSGAVVNVSSVAGTRAFPGLASYCVSKAAVDQLTRVAALDLASQGVRVNAVNPGVVVSNLHRRGGMDETKYEAFLERSKATHPLGRTGTPDEIAALIYYLVSAESQWMTGETISIDGGRHLTCLR